MLHLYECRRRINLLTFASRRSSHEATEQIKLHGNDNDLIDRIKAEAFFAPILDELPQLLDPKTFIGRAPQQVEKYCGPDGPVQAALAKYSEDLKDAKSADLKV